MKYIIQHQDVPEHPHLIVISLTGHYEDEALIECAKRDDQTKSYCAFQAQFIVEGSKIYRI